MKRWLFLAILALPLGGCVLPPAVSIASLALDIGSFAATGKSATDHVISGIAGEDCRMLGILEGEICREEQEFETAVASLEPLRPLPEEGPAVTAPQPAPQFAEARRAPVPLLQPEPPLAPMPLQLASAGADSDVSPLAGLEYLSSDLPKSRTQPSPTATLAEAEPLDPRTAPVAAAPKRVSDPAARQVAALTAAPEEEPAADMRGMVFGDNGQPLGISYAFQDPLDAMDGNRESLSGKHLLDR
jgi:hypothetical protein